MIEVRIRYADAADAQKFCTVPFDQIDTLIPTINAWGIQDEGSSLFGQFVVSDAGAYFEVVIDNVPADD